MKNHVIGCRPILLVFTVWIPVVPPSSQSQPPTPTRRESPSNTLDIRPTFITRKTYRTTFRFPSRLVLAGNQILNTPTANRRLSPPRIRLDTLFTILPRHTATIHAINRPIAAIGASATFGGRQTCQSWLRHDIYSKRIAIFFPHKQT